MESDGEPAASLAGPPRELPDDARRLLLLLARYTLADVQLVRSAPRRGVPLSPHQVRAAMQLAHCEAMTVGELADALGVSLGWASRIADELVGLGHVERERDPQDRRVVRLRLSREARAIGDRIYADRAAVIGEALRHTSPTARRNVIAFLERLTEGMERAASDREAGSEPD